MAERLAVPLDFVFAALAEGQAQATRPRARAEQLDAKRRRGPIVERHPLTPTPEGPGRHCTLDLRVVEARDAVPRVKQAVGELSVVGEQQRALDVDVEAPYRKEPRRGGHEEGDDRPPLGVAARGHVAGGLVEQEILSRRGRADPAALEPDVVDVGIGQRPGLTDDDAVDGDPALEDEAVSPPA